MGGQHSNESSHPVPGFFEYFFRAKHPGAGSLQRQSDQLEWRRWTLG